MSSLKLKDICLLYNTDKNSLHSYVDHCYENLFNSRVVSSTKSLLEIGVDSGGSLMMWKDYFVNANIFGIDQKDCPQIINKGITFFHGDAYNEDMLNRIPEKFDIIIDDGPHTLESMKYILDYYLPKLNDNGILIIEDIQEMNWVNVLKNYMTPEIIQFSSVYDLRNIKGRYDDILLVIDKRGLNVQSN
jgi:23S rRNA U2552 (ribose-2'-O)-methylase RlmE/FtsJ